MAKKNRKKGNTSPSTASNTNQSLSIWWLRKKWMGIAIFALGFLLYANTITHQYTQDDAIVIYENEFTTQGVQGIDELFRYDTFRGFFKEEGKANLVEGGRYRPFTPAMMALEVELVAPIKLDDNQKAVTNAQGVAIHDTAPDTTFLPTFSHLINVLLYAGLCAFLYLLLYRLFEKRFSVVVAGFIALAAAVLFTVHPVHTEVVANIKGRDEIMTLWGSLLALYCSIRAWESKKPAWMIVAALAFFVGLLSKENAITFLAIVPLTFYVFTKASFKDIAWQMLPYVVSAGVFLGLRAQALQPPASLSAAEIAEIKERPKDLMNDPFQKLVGNQYVPFSFGEKTATIATTLIRYVGLLILPLELTHDYYPRHIDIYNWTDFLPIVSLLFYLFIGFYALWKLPQRDPVAYGILFYLTSLSIVSNLFFPIGTNMAERFIFMPSVGFCLVVAYLLAQLFIRKKQATTYAGLFNRGLLGVAIVAIIFGAMTFVRNFDWKDNYTLFLTDIEKSEQSAKLQNSVGGELITQAVKPENSAQKSALLNRAVQHLQKAVTIHPGFKNAYLLLGNAYNYLQQYEKSIQAYEHALQLSPDYEEATNNLGITYREAGKYYGDQRKEVSKAIRYLAKAYELRPSEFETVRLLGVAYGRTGNSAKAIEFFTKATQLEPNNAGAVYDLGTAYHFAGDTAKRDALHSKALQMEPDLLEKRKQNN